MRGRHIYTLPLSVILNKNLNFKSLILILSASDPGNKRACGAVRNSRNDYNQFKCLPAKPSVEKDNPRVCPPLELTLVLVLLSLTFSLFLLSLA